MVELPTSVTKTVPGSPTSGRKDKDKTTHPLGGGSLGLVTSRKTKWSHNKVRHLYLQNRLSSGHTHHGEYLIKHPVIIKPSVHADVMGTLRARTRGVPETLSVYPLSTRITAEGRPAVVIGDALAGVEMHDGMGVPTPGTRAATLNASTWTLKPRRTPFGRCW